MIRLSIKNAKGFSLIEVLIAIGIMSVIGMAITTIMNSVMGQQRLISQKFERSDLENGVRSQLSTVDTCSCNFNGRTFDPSVKGLSQGLSIDAFKEFNDTCTQSKPLAISLAALPNSDFGMSVGQIALNAGFQVNPQNFMFSLQIPYTNKPMSLHPSTIANVQVRTKDIAGGLKQIIACSTNALPELITHQNYKVTCTSLAGATQSISSTATAGSNMLLAMAPSGQGYWAISIANGEISSANNCFSDQAMMAGAKPQQMGVVNCVMNAKAGKACPTFGNCTYGNGGSNSFQSCTYAAQ